MSFKETWRKITNQIDMKSIVSLTGNIEDLYFHPINHEDSKMFPIHELIFDHLSKNKKYDKVFLIDHYGNSKTYPQQNNDNQVSGSMPVFSTVINDHFLPAKEKNEKVAVIINYPEEFLKEKSMNDSGDYDPLLPMMLNTMFDNASNYIKDKRKIILITKQPKSLYSLVKKSNDDYEEIIVNSPDRNERSRLFKILPNEFKLQTKGAHNSINNEESRDHKDAVALTEGFSNKKIMQIAKLSQEFALPIENFKTLYNKSIFAKDRSPWENISIDSIEEMRDTLSKRVKSQENAINKAVDTIIKAITGIAGIQHNTTRNKPKGIAFFVGPTGVGKTELAKAITQLVFGDEKNLLRFDMSEYKQENSDQRLIGSPPGYVGYAEGGQLTNAVKKQPFSIVLFDEIEKAHGSIFDIFLQILEDGRLTSSNGESIDFSETFIIFTSNIGAKKDIGNTKVNYIEEVKHHFRDVLGRPEIFGRINESNVVEFSRIDNDSVQKSIVFSKLDNILEYLLKDKKINLILKDKERDNLFYLIKEKTDKNYGGRDLVNKIEDVLLTPLSKYIFKEKLHNLYEKKDIIVNFDENSGESIFKNL